MSPQLTHGELFAGISGFGEGFAKSGIKTVFRVEIDKYCQMVLRRHYANDLLISDVRQCGAANLPRVDILSFGSPCQDLSVAGRRAGISGKKSGLFHEAIRIVRELQPTFAIWENVPGALSSNRGRDFGVVLLAFRELGAVDICWRTLDSQHFGVPQRRRRIFLVADFAGCRAGEVLLESPCGCRNPPPRRPAGAGTAPGVAPGARRARGSRGSERLTAEPDIAHTLRSVGDDASEDGTGRGTPIVMGGVPFVAAPLIAGSATGEGVNVPGRRREDDHNLVVEHHEAWGTDWPLPDKVILDRIAEETAEGDPLTGLHSCGCGHRSWRLLNEPCPGCGGFRGGTVSYPPPHGTLPDGLEWPPPVQKTFTELGEGHVTYQETDTAQSIRCPGGGGSTIANIVVEPAANVIPFDMRQASRGGTMTNNRGDGLVSGGAPGTGIGEVGDPAPTLANSHTPAVAIGVIPFDTTQITSAKNYSSPKPDDPCHPLASGAHPPAVAFQEHGREQGRTLEMQEELAYALLSPAGGGRRQEANIQTGMVVRRLTPLECERLQGFADGHTRYADDGSEISDSARYRMLGNACSVPVCFWIGARLVRAITDSRSDG